MNPPRSALEQAIEWTACLGDESALPDERRAFERWLHADPANAQAWHKVQGHVQRTLSPVDNLARRTLQAPRPSRRHLLRGALAIAGVGLGGRLLSQPGMPLAEFGADVRTGTGERLSRTLVDGSRIVLNAQSAVDIDFNPSQRQLRLRAGKVIVDATQENRLFQVLTEFGCVQASGARFMVACGETSSRVWVSQSSVKVISRSGASTQLQAGHGALFNDRIELLGANHSGEANWQDGWLNVVDWSLGEVLDAFRPYRPGVLRVSPQAARLRVSGGFSLDHSNRALSALEQTMPLRINRFGDWWVSVELA